MSLRHTLLALVTIVIWGVNFVVIDIALEDMPPLALLALRGAVIVFPAIFFFPRPKMPWRWLLLIGVLLGFGQPVLVNISLALGLPPGLASLLLQTQVIFTILISAVVLREPPTRPQMIGVVVGMTGLAIVIVGHGAAAPLIPAFVALGSAVVWAMGSVAVRAARVDAGLSIVVWSGLVVPIPTFLLSLAIETPQTVVDSFTHITLPVVLATLFSALAASLVGYGIWNGLLTKYPAGAVVPFTLLIPPLGMLTAWIVQGEVPGVAQLVGGVLMMAGLAAAVIRFTRSRT